MTPARFRWGLLLILIGILLLLRNNGILNDNFWGDLLVWFPVVLIAIGIEKIFSNSKFRFISYLTSVGLFFGGLLIAFTGSLGGSQASFFSETTYELSGEPSITKLEVSLKLNSTDLTIRDSGSDLIYARFDRFTRKPKITEDITDSIAHVELSSRNGSFLGGAIRIETGESQDWYIRFSKEVPLDLTCNSDGSDLHMNLSTTPLQQLNLNADNARIYLKLGDIEPFVKVAIRGKDANLRLRLPETIGVRISGDDYRSYLERLGFHEKDGAFITEGFDSAESKIDVDLDNRLESFSLDFF